MIDDRKVQSINQSINQSIRWSVTM